MKVIEGKLQAKDLKFGIVISRFNDFITSRLLDERRRRAAQAWGARKRYRGSEGARGLRDTFSGQENGSRRQI